MFIHCINNGILIEQISNKEQFNNLDFVDINDIYEKFSAKQIENLEALIKKIDLVIPNEKINFIKYDERYQSNSLLKSLCVDGLKCKLQTSDKIVVNKYIQRLKYELSVIDKMNFNDYFLVVNDYVNYAKRNGILVGPGRGSAAGSLVSYLLGITEIDPIKYDLIFERFLNPQRTNMPDIDIDFMDTRRNEVISYIIDKYSSNNVAKIIIFQRIKAKMAIRDIGKILGLDQSIINIISKNICSDEDIHFFDIKESNPLYQYIIKYPKLFAISDKIINIPRQIGIHAAGIVISGSELTELIPIQESSDGFNLTQLTMEYLEKFGLIKIDLLGLNNLTIINDVIELIYKTNNIKINLNEINIKDPSIFSYLSKGNTAGIFQLESPGMINLLLKVQPKNIEDISVVSALYRPGPQKLIDIYLQNRLNPSKIKYLNNLFSSILSSTFNVIVYQEQLMEIVKGAAN
jgi:DNA polymerase-3 subunit alpha